MSFQVMQNLKSIADLIIMKKLQLFKCDHMSSNQIQ